MADSARLDRSEGPLEIRKRCEEIPPKDASLEATSSVHYTVTATLSAMRRMILGILLFGLLGIGIELVLLEHTEGFWQRVPLALIALSFVVVSWHAVGGTRASLRAFQGTMMLFLLSGLLGLALHYRGNVEFELEMYPSRSGWELFREAMMGATPALSPGTMLVLGLLGLAYTYRHPLLTGAAKNYEGDSK